MFGINLSIALTHLKSRRRQSVVSIGGVALGVGFFVAISGLMRGSDADFIDRLINGAPHIVIRDEYREPKTQPVFKAYPKAAVSLSGVKPRETIRGIKDYKGKIAVIKQSQGVIASSALRGQAIIKYGSRETGASVTGIEPAKEALLTTLEDDMIAGSLMALKTESDAIIMGYGLARKLGLNKGDLATVVSTSGLVTLKKIAGLFRTGIVAVDDATAYVMLKDAQILYNRPNVANSIRIRLPDADAAIGIAKEMEARWEYRAESWQEANADILNLLVVRRGILYSVVGAILIVATFGIFNIVSTIVLEKSRDIAILKSMGFRSSDIRKIFLYQGIGMGLGGTIIGWGLGSALLVVLDSIEFRVEAVVAMEGFVIYYGIDQFILAGAVATFAAIAAAWLPARKAAALRPVEIIRGAA